MSLFPTRRRSGSERSICSSPLLIGGFCVLVTAGLLLLVAQSYLSSSTLQLTRIQLIPHLSARRLAYSHRNTESKEIFATLFHTELAWRFKLTQGSDVANIKDFLTTLKGMEDVGITTVVMSTPWEWLEPTEGKLRSDYLDLLAGSVCNNTKLKVALVLDMVRAPDWVFDKWPEAKSMDSHGRQYQLMTWFHEDANAVALQTLQGVATYVAAKHPTCVTAVQPAYNNEYEAKYTQEHDCFQDYSVPALSAYREWLQARRSELDDLNGRWKTSFQFWDEVEPPVLEAGSFVGVDLDPRYWDFLKFREVYGAEVLNRACAVVQNAGVRCFHHVPEVFSVLVAVYGITMFKHIAASPHTDFIVVDSNVLTPYGTPTNPAKLRLFISAAQSYGKPVYLALTLQQHDSSLDALRSGFTHALEAGAQGVGVVNWLSHVPLNGSLREALHPVVAACRTNEVVGVFLHLDSCAAWHGLQWKGEHKDPMHDFTQDLASKLSTQCGSVAAVFLEFDRFLAALPSLDRVMFVEPLVLNGGEELEAYARVRAALSVPRLAGKVQVLPFPANGTGGMQMTVLKTL